MDPEPLPSHEPGSDRLESRLARQPLRSLPPEWRQEILARAQAASNPPAAAVTPRPSAAVIPGWIQWLRELPIAWSALAAVWLCILALNVANGWLNGRPVPAPRISADQWAELKRQQLELGELAGLRLASPRSPSEGGTAPSSPAVLKPRSFRRLPQGPSWVRLEDTFPLEWARVAPHPSVLPGEAQRSEPLAIATFPFSA